VSKSLRFSIQMALATMISRVLGLARDVLFAKEFGSSPEYDAYLVAVLLPFFLRKIFAEGALSSAFVPIYNRRAMKGIKKGHSFTNSIMTVFIPVLLLIVIISIYYMPQIIELVAPGLEQGVKGLSVFLGRLIFPFILFISMWAIYAGMLNSNDIFFSPALSPAVHNIFIIAGILVSPFFDPPILGPAIFFIIGGAAQWIIVMLSSKRIGFKFRPHCKKEDLSEFMPLFLSTFAALSVTQINSIVDTNVVSSLGPGSVSLLQYANRLFQLPLGVFAISVSTVALSQLSRNSHREFRINLAEGIERMVLFVLPATLGLLLLRGDVIRLLFQRGEFGAYDTMMTSEILMGYIIGLPFYSLYALLSRAEYALKNAKIVFVASSVSVAVNIALDITLAPLMGPLGIAVATSSAGASSFLILLVHLLFKGKLHLGRRNLLEITKCAIAAFVMAALLFAMQQFIEYSGLTTLFTIILGIAVYLLILIVMRQRDIKTIFKRILKR